MNKLLEALGGLLLGAGILVIAFCVVPLLGAFFFGSDANATPDASGMVQGVLFLGLCFVGVPFSVVGGILMSIARRAASGSRRPLLVDSGH